MISSKYHIVTLLFLFTINSYSQLYEVGILYGKTNFIGDVGNTTFINPVNSGYGGIIKWNRSPRHAYRISFIRSKLSADDLESADPRRIERGYNFETPINEFSLGMEFNFFDFDLHDLNTLFTPYIYTGLFYTSFRKQVLENNQLVEGNKMKKTLGLPMIIGFKQRLYRNIILSIEIGARYSFTDEIDGSLNPDENYNFGNINNKDWYMFSNFGLTYTFGQNPCYCNIGK